VDQLIGGRPDKQTELSANVIAQVKGGIDTVERTRESTRQTSTYLLITAGFLFTLAIIAGLYSGRPNANGIADCGIQSDAFLRMASADTSVRVTQAIDFAKTNCDSEGVVRLIVNKIRKIRTDRNSSIRDARDVLFTHLKQLTNDNLQTVFADGDLVKMDLYDVDLSGAILRDISLEGVFAALTSFKTADLKDTSFKGAYVRNADFAGAELRGAQFQFVDWYNAKGFTKEQLLVVSPDRLWKCPRNGDGELNIETFIKDVNEDYGFPFQNWDASVQAEISNIWREYMKPGGLCDQVDNLLE
jgi:uncharacterized protein YjbI with pentapeptide repeats